MSAEKFYRNRYSLEQALSAFKIDCSDVPWITFDPDVVHQYRIIRRHSSDGTLALSRELLFETLKNLIRRESYFKPAGVAPPGYMPKYTIGNIRNAIVYGMVSIPASTTRKFFGQRESFIIPVRCEYQFVADGLITTDCANLKEAP